MHDARSMMRVVAAAWARHGINVIPRELSRRRRDATEESASPRGRASWGGADERTRLCFRFCSSNATGRFLDRLLVLRTSTAPRNDI